MLIRAKYTSNLYLDLSWKILVSFLVIFISGILFYAFNNNYFNDLSNYEIIRHLTWSIRYALSAAFMVNLPFIILISVPFGFTQKKFYYLMVVTVFYYLFNTIALLLNFIDIAYFEYSLKRSTADFLSYIGNESSELFSLIPEYIRDFGWEIFFFLLMSFILFWLTLRFRLKLNKEQKTNTGFYVKKSIFFILIFAISALMIRGGFQLKPINNSTAAKHTNSKNIPLILNTPFSIIKTIDQDILQIKDHFTEEKAESIFNPVLNFSGDKIGDKNPNNVVIIILESFTAEYSESLNPRYQKLPGYQGYTPFLDSLMQHSKYFKAYANGKRSVEALPAILSGLPVLMNSDFLSSPYANNNIEGLANSLKNHNYFTAFFHGGNNGTMGFDIYTRKAGFDSYYGRKEYNNDEHFDGKWGIFDEEFLNYFAGKLDQFPQPFMGVVFTLSSHHPYTIPERYKNQFPEGKLKIHKSIQYTDYSLEKFFELAKKADWYKNTLFVITSDHTSETYYPENQNPVSKYEIPLIFFNPADSVNGFREIVAQQADVMPTVIALLGLKTSFVSFGNNLFGEKGHHFAISYLNGIYQFIKNNKVYYFDGSQLTAVYSLINDKNQKNNLLSKEGKDYKNKELFLRALIQQYNNRMIQNKLYAE